MSDEPFNAEYYDHLLSSLTINSRTLITELTAIAEKNPDHSETIVELIEVRIKKCLPQYKLYSFYLLDSIVKNIGNPYNVLFNHNLYKIFTEAYLIVTDNFTRQNLINLFRTWVNGKTNSGLEIFNKDAIARIEGFIIKATSINGEAPVPVPVNVPANVQNPVPANVPVPAPSPVPGATPAFALPSVIVPETFLRECNYLLQYVIQINKDIEPFEDSGFFRKNNRIRNDLISDINLLTDSLLRDSKPEFEQKINYYHETLTTIRTKLDDQNYRQGGFLSKKIKQNLKPNDTYLKLLDRPLESYDDNDDIYFFLEAFGLPIKNEDQRYLPSIESSEVTPPPLSSSDKPEPITQPTGVSTNPLGLGLGLDMMNFDFKRKPEDPPPKPVKKVRFDV